MQGVSAVSLDRPFLPPLRVQLQGFPATFWVVTKPKGNEAVEDVCFEANILRFASMVRGGLDENTIHGIYVSASLARSEAEGLLGRR